MEKPRSAVIESSHCAVLIGIDGYKDNPLKGAVRDVEDITSHMKSMSTATHITMLITMEGFDAWTSHGGKEQGCKKNY